MIYVPYFKYTPYGNPVDADGLDLATRGVFSTAEELVNVQWQLRVIEAALQGNDVDAIPMFERVVYDGSGVAGEELVIREDLTGFEPEAHGTAGQPFALWFTRDRAVAEAEAEKAENVTARVVTINNLMPERDYQALLEEAARQLVVAADQALQQQVAAAR